MFYKRLRVRRALRLFCTGCVFGLTCVDAVLVSGAVAVNGEGEAREGVGCCCCDNSETAPPTATAPVPDVDPSEPEKTPVMKSEIRYIHYIINSI